jgi:hypothetical protein
MLPRRRRQYLFALAMLASGFVFITMGCGGGKSQASALIPTKTTLSASPAAPTLGNPVVLTANVAASSGTGQPTGSVTFTEGGTLLGTANLASGSASFTTNSLPIGVQAITATFGGDSTYSGSSSSNQSLDVVFTGVIAITTSDAAGDQSSTNLTLTTK